MKWLKESRALVVFGLIVLVGLLIMDYMDLGISSRDNSSLQIKATELVSKSGDATYRFIDQTDDMYIDYFFDVQKTELLKVSDEHLYLKIGNFAVQAYEIFVNGHYIGGAGDYQNGHSIVTRYTSIIDIPIDLLEESNEFEIKTLSVLTTGVRGQIVFMDHVDMIRSKSFTNFDNSVILFIVFGTFLLSLGLIYLSATMIRVRDEKIGLGYIWLSVGVIFLAVNYMASFSELFYIFDYEITYRLNRALIYGAAVSMTTATGFWVGRIRRYIVGPLLLILVIAVTFLPINIVMYENIAIVLIAIFMGLNAISIVEKFIKSSTHEEKVLALNVAVTIVLSALIHYFPSIIFDEIILDRTAPGITPLCMFWFLVMFSITKEIKVMRKKEKKESEKLQMQQEHIFKNMGEGFFRVDRLGVIESVLTDVCNKIFGRDISGERVSTILAVDDDAEFYEELLTNFFSRKIAASVCFELFPVEMQIGDQYFKLSYEPEKILKEYVALVVVMSDVTETKKYEETLATERNKLKMVVSTMLNRDDMIELINEFLEFTSDVMEGVYGPMDLMNKIHTFKGNFGMYNLLHIVPFLHNLEEALTMGVEMDDDIGGEMRQTIYQDLEVVTEVTGSSFFEDEVNLSVNKHNLENVYQVVRKYFYDQEASLILNIMEQIFYKSISDVLMFYATESVKTASRKGMVINIATFTGDEVFVDTTYYKDVFRSLVHVFNNCIEHGIEDEEERMIAGKTPYGELACNIDDLGNFFEIKISDDGRGIDLGKVREKALNKSIITEEEAEALTEEAMMMLIFEPNFSTKSYADTLSGRGVGMAAVKSEVERIGGTVRVSSIMEFGTSIRLLLPKNQAKFIKFFSLPIVLDLFVESSKIYLKSNNVIDLPLSVSGINRGVEEHEISVILPFRGPKDGAFYLSGNERLIRGLARAMLELEHIDEVDAAIYEETKYEVMKESLNIMAGNAISLFDVDGSIADIGIPEIVDSSHEVYDFPMITWSLDYDGAKICLGIVNGYIGDVVDMSELLNS